MTIRERMEEQLRESVILFPRSTRQQETLQTLTAILRGIALTTCAGITGTEAVEE